MRDTVVEGEEHRRNGNNRPQWGEREQAAAGEVIHRVRRFVPAHLFQSLLFGSRARGDARPDSDVDILLIFHELPPDREPQASQAEQIADEVAAESGVPVATWSVALVDLEVGRRTPMLVDALDDGLPLWPRRAAPRIAFTPPDALRCTRALLQRVREGGEEVAARLGSGDLPAAARRARGDLVRLCTAGLLLRGETRPRRGDAVWRFLEHHLADEGLPRATLPLLLWAARSYGPDGQDEARPVDPPPGGIGAAAEAMDLLTGWIRQRRSALAARIGANGTHAGRDGYHHDMGHFTSSHPVWRDPPAFPVRFSDHEALSA